MVHAVRSELPQLDALQIADAVWLAARIGSAGAEPGPRAEAAPPGPPAAMPSPLEEAPVPGHASTRPHARPAGEPSFALAATSSPDVSLGRIDCPAPPSLTDRHALELAVRTSGLRAPSRIHAGLDEEATVEQICEEGIWEPLFEELPGRAYEAVIAVEDSAAMGIWSSLVEELVRLFQRSGSFRTVRRAALAADPESGEFELTHHLPGARLKNTGARLVPGPDSFVFLVSDCVSRSWHTGRIPRRLAQWGTRSTIVLFQILPEHLWRRTALVAAKPVRLRPGARKLANAEMRAEALYRWRDEAGEDGVLLPVSTMEPGPLREALALVAGEGAPRASGFHLTWTAPHRPRSRAATRSPESRLESFLRTASPPARRIMARLAAAPAIRLPIIRLLRATTPGADHTHDAEVLLGGLLSRAPRPEGSRPVQPDDVDYDLIEGVREQLLDLLPADESLDTLADVSRYVEQHLGEARGFAASLVDPRAESAALGGATEPFARVAVSVLRRLGGRYSRLAGAPPIAPVRLDLDGGETSIGPARVITAGNESADDAPEPAGAYRVAVVVGDREIGTYEIEPGESFVVGRDPGSDIVAADRSVSRRHCTLTATRDGLQIVDLGSANGILVDHEVVTSALLHPGDQAHIGMVRLDVSGVEPAPARAGAEEERAAAAGTIDWDTKSYRSMDRERLALLIESARTMSRHRDVEGVFEMIMDMLFQIIPVKRAMIVVREDDEVRPVAVRPAPKPGETPTIASSSILRQVMDGGRGRIIEDASLDQMLMSSQSIIMGNIRAAVCVPLSAGDTVVGAIYADYPGRPSLYTDADLDFLAAFAALAGEALERSRLIEQSRLHDRLRRDLEIAREVQRGLLPATLPQYPEIEVACLYWPAREVGGDFYDVIPLPDGRLLFAVGDVAGKSVAASIYMARIMSFLRSTSRTSSDPATVLRETNSLLAIDSTSRGVMFSTAVVIALDRATGEMEWCNAGNTPGLVLAGSSGPAERLDSSAPPLGIAPELEIESRRLTLEPGTIVVLQSDGLVETRDQGGEEYGADRLQRLVGRLQKRSLDEIATALKADVEVHGRGSTYGRDDVVVLMLRYRRATDPA